MRGRLVRGISANLYGQAVTIAIQLGSVPLLLGAWGGARFGVWIMLSALPMALSFADGGLVLASGNAMVMAVANNDARRAADLFRQTLRVILLIAVGAASVAGVVLALSPRSAMPGASILPPAQTAETLLALVAVVLLGLPSSLIGAAFRASGRYAFGCCLNDSIRLAESVAVIAVAISGGGLRDAASAWLAVRVIGLAVSSLMLTRLAPWIALQPADGDRISLRALLRPALASLAIPAAFAVSLQGSVVALGLVVPPSAVAAFAATRTLTRAMVQASGLINHAVMPEMSMAAGRKDGASTAMLERLSLWAAFATLLPAWLVVVAVGPKILGVWTDHRLDVDGLFLALMATAALMHGLWLSQANLLLAVNRQGEYAWAFLVTAALSSLAVPVLATSLGLVGAALAIVAADAAMAVWLVAVRRQSAGRFDLAVQGARP